MTAQKGATRWPSSIPPRTGRRFGRDATTARSNDDDEARAVAVDGGNVVVTASSWNIYLGYYSIDYHTAKYAAANGALLWERRYTARRTATTRPVRWR